MAVISMRDLLETGVHFGHSKSRWNPKMAPFLYGVRNGIHIIDLNKTVVYLEQAYHFVADSVAQGAEVLFVGTKKQAKDVIREEAERAGVPYVNERWVGGLLTNFRTVRKSILKLHTLERMEAEGGFDVLPKKEVRVLRRKMERLKKLYGGIVNMERIPNILWVVDTVRENIAVQEAKKLGITVVAIADSNCDPDLILNISFAFSISPPASSRAFLHSSIPAPVISLRVFTSSALTILYLLYSSSSAPLSMYSYFSDISIAFSKRAFSSSSTVITFLLDTSTAASPRLSLLCLPSSMASAIFEVKSFMDFMASSLPGMG